MSSRPRTPSYRAVLRTPHACRVFSAALLGRLSYGIVPLSLVLALTGATGSYAVAGGVMALFALTVSVLAPVRAGLIDRYGPRRALPPMAVAYALVLAGLAAVTWRPGAPGPLLGGLAMAAGVCAPPLGPVMRTLWSELLPDPALLRRGYSLDAVAEELLFVVGPLLAGLVAGFATPPLGVVVSAGLVLAGTFAFVSAAPVRALSRSQDMTAAGPRQRSRAGFGVAQPVAAALGIGACLGSVELLMVAFAKQHHHAAAVAWCTASLSAGSAIGGLVYGALPWRISGRARLPALVAVPALGLALAGFSPNAYVLALAAGATGLFISPALATAYLIADESAAHGARTRAGAWVNTAVNGGSSGGTATAGLLLGRLPLAVCFAVTALPVLLAAVMVLILYISTTAAAHTSWRMPRNRGHGRRVRLVGGRRSRVSR
jgi:MFS family permease